MQMGAMGATYLIVALWRSDQGQPGVGSERPRLLGDCRRGSPKRSPGDVV